MKRCGKCGEEKPLDAFHRARTGDGRQRWCKGCRKAYDAAYFAANKHRRPRRTDKNVAFDRWYAALKSGSCTDCGKTFPPIVMHWDHLPGVEKIADVGKLAARHNRRLVLAEIAKCELVCANCHAQRTAARRRSRVGAGGFEPPTPGPQSQCSSQTELRPARRPAYR